MDVGELLTQLLLDCFQELFYALTYSAMPYVIKNSKARKHAWQETASGYPLTQSNIK